GDLQIPERTIKTTMPEDEFFRFKMLEERDTEEKREAQKQKKGKNKKKLILKMLEEKDILNIHKATNSKKRITTW
ncbi:18249_t:CDS:2, partial [Gigaspora rosea]